MLFTICGQPQVTVSRDRAGTFAPQMVPKGTRRLTELDIEVAKVAGWKRSISQLAVAHPDRFADYL